MKRRRLTAIVLLPGVLGGIGWRNHLLEKELTGSCTALEAKIATLLELDEQNESAIPDGSSGPQNGRGKAAVEIPALARRVLEIFAASSGAAHRSADDEDLQRRLAAVKAEIARLNPGELEALIDECDRDTDFPADIGKAVRRFTWRLLGQLDPDRLLKQAKKNACLLSDSDESGILRQTAMTLADRDVYTALAWVRRLRDIPGLESSLPTVLRSIATTDPALAFSAIDELLPSKEAGDRLAYFLEGLKTTDLADQLRIIGLTRDYIASHSLTDEQGQQAMADLLSGMTRWEYGDCAGTLAALPPEERLLMAQNLHLYSSTVAPAPWLDWMERELPPEKQPKQNWEILDSWTRIDWAAARAWLLQAPAGPSRDKGLAAFVRNATDTLPEETAAMIMTLSPEESRAGQLQKLVERWSLFDPAAAAGFARKNGITTDQQESSSE